MEIKKKFNQDKYTYILNRKNLKKEEHRYFSKKELELMTTYQLREICYQEKIINGIRSSLDKEELIRQILRFRGRKEHLFITEENIEGKKRLEDVFEQATLHYQTALKKGCAKIIAYENLAITYFDKFTIGYHPDLVDTNAFLVSGAKICAIFQIKAYSGDTEQLYLTKSEKLICEESSVLNYNLYCMDKVTSDLLYHIYFEEVEIFPEHIKLYKIPVMNFQVRSLLESRMPLAIDFGTSNTTAGIYLDMGYMEELKGNPITEQLQVDQINYVKYLDLEKKEEETPILPTVVGIVNVKGEEIQYAFGYEANQIFQKSYLDEGFCIFYDLKRWVNDPERVEELVDRQGHRSFVKRKEIIKAYLEYVISCAKQRFKCQFKELHISAPVKQKHLFVQLFQNILPDYHIEAEDMLDEGVAVLYNSISEWVEKRRYQERKKYLALVMDCGGGTTDLSSCQFQIENQRVSYQIEISTSYENGETNFGGNNLTYRMMQILKIALANQFGEIELSNPSELLEEIGEDNFRLVDEVGSEVVYKRLEEEYQKAEKIFPTQFKEYEHQSNQEYYAVKNNFYFLFQTAEQMKQEFYGAKEILRIAVSSISLQEIATKTLKVEKWKLSKKEQQGFTVLKDIPTVYFSINEFQKLLKADIYEIVKRFIEPLYEKGELQNYSIMKLTGQSCRIELFREALKEFIPGKIIESSKNQKKESRRELKLSCLNGAIKYLRDKKFGYAKVNIRKEQAAFPYLVIAYTHTGEEKVLIHSLNKEKIRGYISRTMADLTLELTLKNPEEKEQYKYHCSFDPKKFVEIQPEEVVSQYKNQILQEDVDTIIEQELKFFVLADEENWGFHVVPVLRKEGKLRLGEEKFFLFETEEWVTNFFDGTR